MNGTICYIGIGSNLGDALKHCRDAVKIISHTKGMTLQGKSSFYKTEPVGIEEQNDFINAVVEIKTTILPKELLDVLQKIESTMGRIRKIKGGPRVIDLDIIFYGQSMIREPNLIIPHPEMHKRRFVLEPLCEIASYFIHPAFGISIRGLMDRLNDHKIVERIH